MDITQFSWLDLRGILKAQYQAYSASSTPLGKDEYNVRQQCVHDWAKVSTLLDKVSTLYEMWVQY